MSTTCVAFAIVGCSIPFDSLFKKINIQHIHPYPENAKFCPECGEKIVKEKLEFIGNIKYSEKFLGDYKLVFDDEGKYNAFIGIFAHDGGCEPERTKELPRLEHLKKDILDTLKKYGLEKYIETFGLHSMLCYY